MISSRGADGAAHATPEEADDLLALRRVIARGDLVTGSTTRAIRAEREHARPDRGERVHIRVTVRVERVALDSVLDRLRISGPITASSHESVSHGSHHSVTITPGERITITKRSWTPLERRLLRPSRTARAFVLVAVDTRECGVARLSGTRLHALPNIYSGIGGKRYRTSHDATAYRASVRTAVSSCFRAGDGLVVFGPGEEKRRTCAALSAIEGAAPVVVEGIDSGGEDGIHVFTRSEAMRKIMSETKLARVLGIVEEAMRRAGMRSRLYAMGHAEVSRAVAARAASDIVFSDRLLADAGEEAAVELLNGAEAGGAAVHAVDTSTDAGLRVSGLGGVIALLRFAP
ncbi:MAG: mRNA surveillance protein Pelota [Thaumarchaeota archaeon]|nr:mRNA surveillance protein Pelota [Nitrososphaerota archaeon]